jgi:MFS transporter, DHA1 family, inner membrane transport protein
MSRLLAALSFGNFAVGSGAFMVAAIVSPVAAALSVSLAEAGRMLSVYAIAYAVASPILITLLGQTPRRLALAGGLLLVAAGAAGCALARDFSTLELGRIAMAFGAGVFTPIAAATAGALSAPEKRGASLATVFLGLSVAQVLAVPAAGPLAAAASWSAPFWALAGLAVLAAGLVFWATPKAAPAAAIKLSALGAVLRRPDVLAAYGVICFHMAANFAVFTFMGPVLGSMSGFGADGVAALFWVFGVAAMAGAWAGGQLADKLGPEGALMAATLGLGGSLILFGFAQGQPAILVMALACWGVFGFSVNAAQQARIFAMMGAAAAGPALALNASALYVGTALGGWAGAAALPQIGLNGLPWVGLGMAVLALASLSLSQHLRSTSETPA